MFATRHVFMPSVCATAAVAVSPLIATAQPAFTVVKTERLSKSRTEGQAYPGDKYRNSDTPALLFIPAGPGGTPPDHVLVAFASTANDLDCAAEDPFPGGDDGEIDVYLVNTQFPVGDCGRAQALTNFAGSALANEGSSFPAVALSSAGPGGSPPARVLVAFQSNRNPVNFGAGTVKNNSLLASDIYLLDASSGQYTLVSHANGQPAVTGNSSSGFPVLSADGRYVVYSSFADDIVNPSGGRADIYRYDIANGTNLLISTAPPLSTTTEIESFPAISSAGDRIVFESTTSTQLLLGITEGNDGPDEGGQANFGYDIALARVDAQNNVTLEALSVNAAGTATANDQSRFPAITEDGRYVAFVSWASDLIPGDTNSEPDLFVRDLDAPAGAYTARASVGMDESEFAEASGCAWCRPAIIHDADNGVVIAAFATLAPFDAIDTNGAWDIYLRVMDENDLDCGDTHLLTVGFDALGNPAPADLASFTPAIVRDETAALGQSRLFIAFNGYARNLEWDSAAGALAPDPNQAKDVFVSEVLVSPPAPCP